MSYKIAVLPGEGIGHDVASESIRVLKSLPIDFDFVYGDIGFETYQKVGNPLPEKTINLVRDCDSALFGAVTTPPNIKGYRSPIVALRKLFNLYANVRPCKSFPTPKSWKNIDIIVIRENTEGLYVGNERVEDEGDTAITERIFTKKGCERIIRYGLELAKKRGRKKVTFVHKANVMRETCGMFLRLSQEISKEYQDIEYDEKIVDAMTMQLIKNPQNFDVIVTTNMFGDILSDECSILVGGLGLAYSGNIGDEKGVFEPVHGSAPKYAGKNVANPSAMILAAKFMLENLREEKYANIIENAVLKAIKEGKTTKDLSGNLSTIQMTDAIIENIRAENK